MEITFQTLMKLKKVTDQGWRDYRSVGFNELKNSHRRVLNKICEDEEIVIIAGTVFFEMRKIRQRAGIEMEKVQGREDDYWNAVRSTPQPEMSDRIKEDRAYLNQMLNEKDFNEVIREMKQEGKLKCQRCGYCCTVLENEKTKKNPGERCEYMLPNNSCSIYHTDLRRQMCPGISLLFSKDKDLYFIVAINVLDVLKEVCLTVNEFWDRMMEKEKVREIKGEILGVSS